ncbi:MAG: RICIN domain-containing protein [Bacteroidaceae bacterium]|nr:RICIN domain-containing protein [Bacteroidaceae bacterium]
MNKLIIKKTVFLALWLCFLSSAVGAKSLVPGTDYYLWLNIYEKLIGNNEAGTAPALSAFGVAADPQSYVFTAEDAGTEGYVLLKQKSSGRYLAASSSNSYSMTFENSRSTDNRFLWSVDEGTYVYLKNKKSGKFLGVDGANKGSEYVGVYYDKPKGSHSQFTAIPVVGETWDEARAAYVSEEYTNAQGVREIDYCLIKDQQIDRDDAIDIHVTANEKPLQGTTKINLGSDSTWLIIDNIVPSNVINNYLKYVTINGKKASNNSNCRVAIYLNGAAIIPLPKSPMTCQGTNGEFTLTATNNSDLGKNANSMTSFTLRRGYMATVASGTKGSGYSRVFVADHADLEVTLPTALAKRVSSVNIKPWPYLSKKGMGNRKGSSGIDKLRANWYWTWSAGYSSATDYEYVPCLQHRYWPSASDVNSKTATASLSLNEPEHSEQHNNCSCGGTTDEWTAYTFNDNFLPSGGRIGSPQPTDFGYLTNFFKHVDDMASRCDFAVTHSYWDLAGMNETAYADWYCNTKCKSVWNNTGRPLWISEFNISASWNSNNITSYEQHRKYMQVLLQKVEECPWIERYAVYLEDKWETYMFYENNPEKGLTPAGQVYRDHRSTFAYNSKYTKVPTWWAPAAKTPSLVVKQSTSTGKLTFQITNPNGDFTESLVIERLAKDGMTWQPFAEVTDRYRFDSEKFSLSGIDSQGADIEVDQFRVTVTTLSGKVVSSSTTDGYILNPRIEADSKESINGWTCSRDAANGNTKATGDTYLEVWDATAANINFDYYQDVTELENGVYELSAVVFNTANGVEGAYVNGAVGLYALTEDQFYFAPVTDDAANDPEHPIESSTTDINNLPRITISDILVTDGKLRVGVRNLGTMTARWAGADNFVLRRKGDIASVDIAELKAKQQFALYRLMPVLAQTDEGGAPVSQDEELATPRDATRFLINPDCNRKNNFGWTASNVDFKTDAEAYDAVATNTYWNIWKSGAFNSSLKQEIKGLPEGSYSFCAILRGQNTAKMTLIATTPTDSIGESFVGGGATAIEGSPYPMGWQLVKTPAFTVQSGETVTLSLAVECTATAWWSADHFALTLESIPEELTVGMEDYLLVPSSTGVTRLYDLSGRAFSAPSAPGLYLLNGRKVLIK